MISSPLLPKNLFHHQTVLLEEAVNSLGDVSGKIVADCTLGGGGHTRLLLDKVGANGKVLAFDRDLDALENARTLFHEEIACRRLLLIDSLFSGLRDNIAALGLHGKIAGVLADIGVSSHQIDTNNRGFSFSTDGPLDMRMDNRVRLNAAEFLNTADEVDIAHVIWAYGEEHKSRHIARLIVRQRAIKPFKTTFDLANLISRARLWKEKSKKTCVWGSNADKALAGGRYDPTTDSWSTVSTVNAPGARTGHTSISTGTRLIIWGGSSHVGGYCNTGGQYYPVADSWTPTSTVNTPAVKFGHTAIWSGARMIVWGGSGSAEAQYNPATDSWTPTSLNNAPSPRVWHSAIWTGTKIIVWGGGLYQGATNADATYVNTGGQYTP